MKTLLFCLLGLFALACTPLSNGGGNGPKIKAKVVRITCASTVIQIIDSNYYALGETWIKYGTSDTIVHAANVLNKCEFPESLTEGNEFYLRQITASQASHDCAICMLYDGPPSKGIYIKVAN